MIGVKRRFVVACGGTGGHVFPGLAVAQELKTRGHHVELWLSGRDVETSSTGSWSGDRFSTGMRQLSVRAFPAIVRSFFRCRRQMRLTRPDVLLAMGSYSSLPPVMAARMCQTPVMLHEANAVPGKAVDLLSRFAAVTAISFEETAKWLPDRKTVMTGLPVRRDLAGRKPMWQARPKPFTVLITGGSQGAHRVNQLTAKAMCRLKNEGAGDLFVIHQTGRADEAIVRAAYVEAGVRASVSAFIEDMGEAYATADLVICRAGASTCFELCLLGKPALLIPLPTAVRDHQRLNAETMVRRGAADEAFQEDISPRSLMSYVKTKMDNRDQLAQMSQAALSLAMPDAALRVADALEDIAAARV